MSDRSEFKSFLEQQVRAYKRHLEDMFGEFDKGFVFGTIKKTNDKCDRPSTDYPNGFHYNGNCVVDIHITAEPWENCFWDQGAWQVAHECVHLLDPTEKESTTFLEEGLAAWFQDEPGFHDDRVEAYIERGIERPPEDNYTIAKELVSRCIPMGELIPVVKQIRLSNVKISDITADMLAPCLPNVDPQTIAHLCIKFPS